MQDNTFVLDTFQGPLDALLLLIRKNDVNIYDIPIAEITAQFMDYLDYAVSVDLSGLADFYAMAADLLHIKTRMMLPLEMTFEGEDEGDPRAELVEKLIEYQKFKKLSAVMEERIEADEWSLERESLHRVLPFQEAELWEKADTWAIIRDMQKVIRKYRAEGNTELLELFEEISVNEKITLIAELLENRGECFFTDIITRKGSALDVVCAFMAILEAVKTRMISVYQNRMYADMKICGVGGVRVQGAGVKV
jgi:segregation and condensation protein A